MLALVACAVLAAFIASSDPQGVWSTYANRTPFHLEGGKGTTSKVVKFQLRPDPLATWETDRGFHTRSWDPL
jgi:hypothetical protein